MYNRYVPANDGGYQHSRMPDKTPRPQASKPPPSRESRPEPGPGIGAFLKNLLPRDFDAEDMLVVLLLLLMCREEQDDNSPLLTLALYLFL